MRPTFFRLLAALTVVLSFALAGCGNKDASHLTHAETEGPYIEVNGLKYQVQVSRQLNPLVIDDKSYLEGVQGGGTLAADEEWFAIFMRVENDGKGTHETAKSFQIHDTQDNVYTPVSMATTNEWAYRPGTVPPGEVIPIGNSPAGERQPFGTVILFKLKRKSLDNRPLELIVQDPSGAGHDGTINLDV
jgi:hypothetical protein